MNLMKNTLIATLALFAGLSAVSAQKFAYVDTDYVLLHIQEYADAQTELNQMAIDWQVEIETKMQSIERLELAYRAERVLLTAEMRAKREEEISTKRLEARELQKLKFGVDGELFQKRQELTKMYNLCHSLLKH